MWGRGRQRKRHRETETEEKREGGRQRRAERDRLRTSSPKAKSQAVIRLSGPLFCIFQAVTLHLCEQSRASSSFWSGASTQWVWSYRKGNSSAFYKASRCQCPDLTPFHTVTVDDGGCLQVRVLLDFLVLCFMFTFFMKWASLKAFQGSSLWIRKSTFKFSQLLNETLSNGFSRQC